MARLPVIKTRPRRQPPPRLSRSMMALLAGLAKKSGAIDPRLIENWAQIVGEETARMCRPIRLKAQGRAKTLEIAVSNGPSAMAVQFRQQDILARVNQWLGRNAITRLTIRQTGALRAGPAMPAPLKPAQKPLETPQKNMDSASGSPLEEALNRLKNNVKRPRS